MSAYHSAHLIDIDETLKIRRILGWKKSKKKTHVARACEERTLLVATPPLLARDSRDTTSSRLYDGGLFFHEAAQAAGSRNLYLYLCISYVIN